VCSTALKNITNNKPDIIIRDNEKGICVYIDAAISGDGNVINKLVEKILKNYKYLTKEIQRVWNVRAKAILVIRGATGTISKSLNNI
jgi:hypothetical protein